MAGAPTFAGSLKGAACNATVFEIGLVGGSEPRIPVMPIMLKILGHNTGSTADLRAAARSIGSAGIRPVSDRVSGSEETVDGCRYLRRASHVDKAVIRLD